MPCVVAEKIRKIRAIQLIIYLRAYSIAQRRQKKKKKKKKKKIHTNKKKKVKCVV
jgi:hypothetical protein